VATYSECGSDDLRLKTYVDNNNCSLQYDLPVDDNTNVVCNYTETLTTNGLILIMGIILLILIVLWLLIKNPALGISSFLVSVLMTFYVYENVGDGVVFVAMLVFNMVLLILTL